MDDKVLVALIAAGGVVAGSVIATVGQVVQHCLRERSERQKDEKRREVLRRMLNDKRHEWRKLDTLRHVIGTDAETAKRLLIDVDARASENGKEVWALLSRHPLGSDDPE